MKLRRVDLSVKPLTFAEVQSRRIQFLAAFGVRVQKTDTCWLWAGAINKKGYGYYNYWACDGKIHQFAVHRLGWSLLRGEIPDGLVIDHLCRVHHCVNPEHLEIVTDAENVLRGVGPSAANLRKTHCKRGHALTADNVFLGRNRSRTCRICRRNLKRARNGWKGGSPSKSIPAEAVAAIRAAHSSGVSQKDLGAKFGVHPATISRIVRYESRKECA